MRLHALRFRHVGPFGAGGVALEGLVPGLNVVCQTNEFGKSTVLRALEMFLFQPFGSGAKPVRALHTAGSEDGPEAEIAFSVDGRGYLLRKRFLRRKSAELLDAASGQVLAEAREADERLAALLRAENVEGGPSGLLWVRQGTSMDGIRDDGQVASRLEGELGTLVGGDRARDHLARVERELGEYLTPTGQEKARGPLRLAREAMELTAAELEDARRKRDTTLDTGRELERVRSAIARLEAEATGDLSGEIAEAEAALLAAEGVARELELLRGRRDLVAQAAERAAERSREHVEAVQKLNAWTEERAKAEAEREQLDAALAEKSEALTALQDAVAALDAELARIEQRRSAREDAAKRTARLEQLLQEHALLAERVHAVSDIEEALRELDSRLRDLPEVRDRDVEALRTLRDRVRATENQLAGIGTRLRLDLEPGAEGRVSVDGRAVDSGPLELAGGAVLRISSVGTLRGDDLRVRELKAAMARADSELSRELERLGVDAVEDAARLAGERAGMERERAALGKDLLRVAPEGASSLRERLEAVAGELETLSEAQADDDTRDDSIRDESEMRSDIRESRAKLEVAKDEFSALRERRAGLDARMASLKERVAGLGLAPEETERERKADALTRSRMEAERELRVVEADLEAKSAGARGADADMLRARLTRLREVDSRRVGELNARRLEEATLVARREAAFDGEDADGVVAALEAQLELQTEELERHERDVAARVLLRDTLQGAQSRLEAAYTQPVRDELAPLLARVIHGAEAGLDASLSATEVTRGGRTEALEQLSGGTREQIAILTRLAYARLLARGGAAAPVILDDALVYADDRRRDAMFDVLGYVSEGPEALQVLYLSCHAGATERLGGHRVTVSPWPS